MSAMIYLNFKQLNIDRRTQRWDMDILYVKSVWRTITAHILRMIYRLPHFLRVPTYNKFRLIN